MLKFNIFSMLTFCGMLIGPQPALAVDQSEINSVMYERAKAYQMNYLNQKALPNTATPYQRLQVQAQSFAAADEAIGKLQNDRFNETVKFGADLEAKMRKDFTDAMSQLKALGIDIDAKHQYTDEEKEAIKKKIGALVEAGKLVPHYKSKKAGTKLASASAPVTPIKSKVGKKSDKRADSKRDKGGDAGGAEGAKAVEFKGTGSAAKPSDPAEVGGADAVQFGK